MLDRLMSLVVNEQCDEHSEELESPPALRTSTQGIGWRLTQRKQWAVESLKSSTMIPHSDVATIRDKIIRVIRIPTLSTWTEQYGIL